MRSTINYFLFVLTLVLSCIQAIAQSNGDYQSAIAIGNWSGSATWQKYNAGSWTPTATPPTSANGVITISSGNTISITAGVTADQIVVSAGATLIIKDGITLTLNDGTGTDLDVYGTLQEVGTGATGASITISGSASIAFENGGLYQHNFSSTSTQGNIPIAAWNTGSTCAIIGFTGNGATLHAGNLNQQFYNFTWNCPNQTSAYGMQGLLTAVKGNFTMQSSGTPAQTVYGLGASSGGLTMTITDSMIINGGIFDFANSGASGTFILNIGGGYYQTGGTFKNDFATGMIVHFDGTAGTFTKTPAGTLTSTYMNFQVDNGATLSLYDSLNVATAGYTFVVNNGATLYCGTDIIYGAGNFTLNPTGILGIGSPGGITSSGATGNIQVTGTRTFDTQGNYIYDGGSAQNSGNGLPSQVNDLTLTNSSNCTLTTSTSVAGTLYLTSGIWIVTNDTLTLGKNVGATGALSVTSGWVDGYFRRWIPVAASSNILFPVGSLTSYNPGNVSFTSAPAAGGTINSIFISSYPGTLGLPITDAGDQIVNVGQAYWAFNTGNTFAGGIFNLNLYATGFPGVVDFTKLHIIYRTGSGASWTTNGTHSAGTGSNAAPVANRTSMTAFGNFGVGSPVINPLPVELISFDATPQTGDVLLTWSTASEINNDYFTIERSQDGISFKKITTMPGHGNSTQNLAYTALDNTPIEGTSYYRLVQTDYDGTSVYFPMKAVKYGLENNDKAIKLTAIWPNPFNNSINISYSLARANGVEIKITNTFGQLIYEEAVNASKGFNSFSFNGNPGLSSGVYFVSIISDGEQVMKKIVKN